jgi:hypothetical protein
MGMVKTLDKAPAGTSAPGSALAREFDLVFGETWRFHPDLWVRQGVSRTWPHPLLGYLE